MLSRVKARVTRLVNVVDIQLCKHSRERTPEAPQLTRFEKCIC